MITQYINEISIAINNVETQILYALHTPEGRGSSTRLLLTHELAGWLATELLEGLQAVPALRAKAALGSHTP